MDKEVAKPNFCKGVNFEEIYNISLSFLITTVLCLAFYKYLKNRTINIEKFSQSKKLTYSIDGTDFNVKK